MSASDKKKLRKEQQSAAMTEKQLAEQKKQKKQKATTLTFVIAMVLVVATVLVAVLHTPITNVMMQNTVSLNINDHEVDAVEFNYHYRDYINNFYDQFSSYGTDYQDLYVQLYTGMNPTKPLDSQIYNKDKGTTWADYFKEMAIESAKWIYTMCDAAEKAGHKLTENEQTSLDNLENTLKLYAAYTGVGSVDTYLKALYGSSASLASYKEYVTASTLAASYANAYMDGLKYTDTQFREFEAGKENQYNSYSYAFYYVKADSYLTGGTTTKDENGKETTTYSDAEKQAARDAALVDAKALAESTIKTLDELNAAIKALEINKENANAKATEGTSVFYSNLPNAEGMTEWISDLSRQKGDITYIVNKTHTHTDGSEHKDDEENGEKHDVINGYYVVLHLDTIENKMNIGTVRHLLIMFKNDEGKTYSNGIKEFTDNQKASAYATANSLLNKYKLGEMTEEKFTELVKSNSEDTGTKSNGGLISNITPDSGYVKAFTEWAIADHEKGDVEIIETEYGYHIMYYVEKAELNYRDTLINNDMKSEAYEKWEEELLKPTTVQEGDMKFLNTSLIISR